MKKLISLVLSMLLVGAAFCQENAEKNLNNESVEPIVEFLLDLSLKDNQLQINKLSYQLTNFEKVELYKQFKKSETVPVLLNTVLGFGIGSFVSGDKMGGLIGLGLDSTAILAFSIQYSIYQSALAAYQKNLSNRGSSSTSYHESSPDFNPVFPILLFIGSRVFEVVRANLYVKNYNKTLINSLGLNSFRMSMLPSVTPDGNLAMTLGVNFSL